MKRQNIQKKTFRLKDNHTWTAPKGFVIFMTDRGAVSFNMPEKWHVAKLEPVEIYDREPPDDNTRLSLSYWRLPTGIDWSGLPQDDLLAKSAGHTQRGLLETTKVAKFPREDLEIFWMQQKFLDPVEKRDAFSRISVARGWGVQALITIDYWASDAPRIQVVWHEVMRSLQLGRTIADPLVGETHH